MFLYLKAFYKYITQSKPVPDYGIDPRFNPPLSKKPFSYFYSFFKAIEESRKIVQHYDIQYYKDKFKLNEEYIPQFKNLGVSIDEHKQITSGLGSLSHLKYTKDTELLNEEISTTLEYETVLISVKK
jgi:hypothetical protein